MTAIPETAEAMRERVRASIARQTMMTTLGVELVSVERGRTAPRPRSRSCRPR
jgi:hypothetical protein